MTAALELHDVSAEYGPFRALFGISLRVEPGEALALVGHNGAGKTTVARVASGLLPPCGGTVEVGGVDMSGAWIYRYARAGVAHAIEGRSVFATLSVEDNLALSLGRDRGRDRKAIRSNLERAYELFPVLGRRRSQVAGTLSGGEQRMLSLARVLVENPKVLIADELSLGLAPVIVDELYQSLTRLRDEGVSLLIIEQQVSHALAIADRVALLDHGTISWTGDSAAAADVVHGAFESVS